MQIKRLREETEADHRAVEASLALMSSDLRLDGYLDALQRMYGLVSPWELMAEIQAPAALRPIVQARSRRLLLEADIHFLKGRLPVAEAPLPQLTSHSELLGALYVMEGSRLGGQFIARHVDATLGLKDGLGTAFFRGFGEKTGSAWKELLSIMESDIPECEADSTILAARAMYQTFGKWMTSMPHVAPAALPHRAGESFNV